MSDQIPAPHPHHRKHLALLCLAIAAGVALTYHHFLGLRGYGISLLIFMAAAVAGALIIGSFTGNRGNKWSQLFLIPIVAGSAASMLYAGSIPQVLGLCLAFFSLVFFIYWLTAPSVPFAEVPGLWHSEVVDELFRSFGAGALTIKELQLGKGPDTSKIVRGLIVAVPFLFVFLYLFMSADASFEKTINNFFNFDLDRRFWFYELPRDLAITYFVMGLGWTMLTRSFESRRAAFAEHLKEHDTTVTGVFLGCLNALFLFFVWSQIKFLTGGVGILANANMTLAANARDGFFQLLVAAGLVFAIVWYLYKKTNLQVTKIKFLTLALIAETGVIIASALRRVMMYMNEYGYTVSRVWAIFIIVTIAAVLGVTAGAAILKKTYRPTAKFIFLGVLFTYSALLFVNVEGMVAKENVSRYLQGKTNRLDLNYLQRLSSDAIPSIHDLLRDTKHGATTRVRLQNKKCQLEELAKRDWRNLVLSDYRALAVLSDERSSPFCDDKRGKPLR